MKKTLLLINVLFFINSINSQTADTTKYSFSLQQAIDYALKNQLNVKNAAIDEAIALKKISETRGIGLPQINASFDTKDMITIPTTVAPAGAFAPGVGDGKYMALAFGTKYQATAGIDASQLLFSGEYLVGLQASKAYASLSTKALERTKIETAVAVSKAYYASLINQQRMTLMDANIERIKTAMGGAEGMVHYGFAEKLDYDRLAVTHNNLLVEKEKVQRLLMLSVYLLKYQMGMDVYANLELTDKIEDVKLDAPTISQGTFDYEKRNEFQLFKTQAHLAKLDLKRNKFSCLPSAAAYASYGSNGFSRSDSYDLFKDKANTNVDATNPSEIKDWTYFWYPYTIIGAKITFPIFSGFQRNARIQQAKLNLEKAENNIESMKKSIDLELASSSTMLQNASVSLENQKKNIVLAEEVYRVTKYKYDQGVGTNLEVVTAESALKEAQVNYYNALFDAIVAKIDFDKANGNFKY
jgi:outer membrane protein